MEPLRTSLLTLRDASSGGANHPADWNKTVEAFYSAHPDLDRSFAHVCDTNCESLHKPTSPERIQESLEETSVEIEKPSSEQLAVFLKKGRAILKAPSKSRSSFESEHCVDAVPNNEMRVCQTCKGRLILGSGELICESCGIVHESFEDTRSMGNAKFGRAPESVGVVGNNLGDAPTLKDGTGRNSLYAQRGCPGVFPYYDPTTHKVIAGASLMRGHIQGIEENGNMALTTLKERIMPALARSRGARSKSNVGEAGTQLSQQVAFWIRAAKKYTRERKIGDKHKMKTVDELLVLKADIYSVAKKLIGA